MGSKDKKAPSRAEPKKPGKGKRRKSQNDKASRTFIESEMPDDEKEDDRVSEAPQKTVTASVRNTWAHNVLSSNPKRLAKQFGSAKKFVWESGTATAFEKNSEKNRYDDVKCFDQTRVKLVNAKSDYIHANLVRIPGGVKFICAQAPLETTIDDFWRMIVQEDIRVIIMLCPLAEEETEKSALYWPAKRDAKADYAGIRVTHKEQKQHGETTATHLLVESKTKPPWTLYHLQYDKWPDHFSPEDPKETVRVLKMAKEKVEKTKTPILIHCSAGIGRTCTVVAVDWAYTLLKANESVDMVKILQEIRKQRAQGIQNAGQFVFAHICVLQMLIEDEELRRDDRFKNFQENYVKFVRHQIDKHKKRKEEKKDEEES